MELKGPAKFSVQDLRQSLLLAGKSMSCRKLAMLAAVSLAFLEGWGRLKQSVERFISDLLAT